MRHSWKKNQWTEKCHSRKYADLYKERKKTGKNEIKIYVEHGDKVLTY